MRSMQLITPLLVALSAAALPVHAEFRVGFVDAAKLLDQAPQAEAARKKIEAEFGPRQKELLASHKALKGVEDKLAKDEQVLSEAERRKLERDIVARRRELKNSEDEFRDDLTIRRNEELGRLQKDVYAIIVGLAKQEKFDVILGDGVIYAAEQVDISNKVLARLKQSASGAKAE